MYLLNQKEIICDGVFDKIQSSTIFSNFEQVMQKQGLKNKGKLNAKQ